MLKKRGITAHSDFNQGIVLAATVAQRAEEEVAKHSGADEVVTPHQQPIRRLHQGPLEEVVLIDDSAATPAQLHTDIQSVPPCGEM